LEILQGIVLICGLNPITHWLLKFRVSVTAASSSSSSSSQGELEVESAALLLAELATELGLLSPNISSQVPSNDEATERSRQAMLHNVIQMCILLRLLGSGTDSGNLKISELASLLEDSWLLAIPSDGVRVSNQLANCRYRLLLQVSELTFLFL